MTGLVRELLTKVKDGALETSKVRNEFEMLVLLKSSLYGNLTKVQFGLKGAGKTDASSLMRLC